MIVRAKRYGGDSDFSDMDMFEIDEDMENMTKALPVMGRAASRNRHAIAPILEPEDDYDDFDASEFVARSYQ